MFISAMFVDSFDFPFYVPDCFYFLTEIMFVHGKLHLYLFNEKTPSIPHKDPSLRLFHWIHVHSRTVPV